MSGEKIELPNNLSLRDYFAAAALQGAIAAQSEFMGTWKDAAGPASFAYELADAMLAAREAALSQQAVSEREIVSFIEHASFSDGCGNIAGPVTRACDRLAVLIAAIEAQSPSGPPVCKYCGMCMPSKAYMHQPAAIEAQQNTAGIELPGIRQIAGVSAPAAPSPASRTGLPNNCEGGMQPTGGGEELAALRIANEALWYIADPMFMRDDDKFDVAKMQKAAKDPRQVAIDALRAQETVLASPTQPPAQQPQQDVVDRLADLMAMAVINDRAAQGITSGAIEIGEYKRQIRSALATTDTRHEQPAIKTDNTQVILRLERAFEVLREGLRRIADGKYLVPEHHAAKALARADAILKGEA